MKLRTKKEVIANNPELRRLINAVYNRIDKEDIETVVNHGANAGVGCFIYYADTCKFARYYRKDIIKLLEYCNAIIGEYDNLVSLVQSFNCYDKDMFKPLLQYIGGGRVVDSEDGNATGLLNLMAWFALKEICRMFESRD